VWYTNYVIPGTHALLIIIGFLTDILKIDGFKSIASVLGMMLILNLLCVITISLTAIPTVLPASAVNIQAFVFWFRIELVCIIGLTFSLVLFMSMRSCCRNKISIDINPANKALPEIDTILAVQDVILQFGSFYIPLCVIFFVDTYYVAWQLTFI
jgi:hypothetical protein